MNRIILLVLTLYSTMAIAESSFERAEKARLEKNWSLAVSEYEKAANEGNPVAAHWLATFYYDGVGVEQNYVHAAAYFNLAANEGLQGSMVYLANMHATGQGATKDCDKAESWVVKFTEGPIPEGWKNILNECRFTFNKKRQSDA